MANPMNRAGIRSAYTMAYLGLVATTLALPGAKPFGINIKFILAGLLLLLAAIYPKEPSEPLTHWPTWKEHLRYAGVAGLILIIWSLIAVVNHYDPLQEIRSMTAPLILLIAYHPHRIRPESFLRITAISIGIYLLWKIVAAFSIYFGWWSFTSFYELMHAFMGAEFVGSHCCKKGFYNIVVVNDLMVAFFPLLLLVRRFNNPLVIVTALLGGVAILISYSRYLMLAYVMILALSYICMNRSRILVIWAVTGTLMLGIFTATWGQCFVSRLSDYALHMTQQHMTQQHMTQKKGLPTANAYADKYRHAEAAAMLRQFKRHPWLGSGIGSYPRDYIRLPRYPYSYELFLFSYIYKFGIIGFLVITAVFLRYMYRIMGSNIKGWLALSVAIASGLADPYYESGVFALVLLLVAITTQEYAFVDSRPSKTILKSSSGQRQANEEGTPS